jgi:hypothetical protein
VSPEFELADDVLVREVDGLMVIVNLVDERWYELDPVGADVVQRLTTSPYQEALLSLQSDYDIEIEQLRSEIDKLVSELLRAGLLRREGSRRWDG